MNAASPITVVLVDDHRTGLRGLEWLINAERPAMSVVGTATTIDEACRVCADHRPDVLILDLDLGGDDGANAIPALIANGHTAVLVLTGVRDPERHQAAVIAGARGVVPNEAEAELTIKAIKKVHAGEIWLDRCSTENLMLTLARQTHSARATSLDTLMARLTTREREIILTLSTNAGAPAKEIAALLGISGRALRHHLTSIYDKLGVSTRLVLYECAQKHHLARKPGA